MPHKTKDILDQMPDEFTRQEFLEKAKEAGFSYSMANQLVYRFKYDGRLEITARGEYKKI